MTPRAGLKHSFSTEGGNLPKWDQAYQVEITKLDLDHSLNGGYFWR